ncbi:hypothetical protein B0H67DRAFT_548229 [Lasiosphaeris hirsuta]|uniref:Uncharacterized protein n=1 Tax=Lasiosphaeris hirsuta TaxID=260670 RepID=A0AA40EAM6_9PEZI|nr:hypothetical protein B0H67DRAFT_548229 [Lasiosphaeris hirsuta]
MDQPRLSSDGTTMGSPSKASPPGTSVAATSAPSGAFPGLHKELNNDLHVIAVNIEKPGSTVPTSRKLLCAKAASIRSFLPGQPRIRLPTAASQDVGHGREKDLASYLRESHLTEHLDDLLPYMRYIFVQTPSYKHIMPLHHQKAHAREVIVDENPGLHLVWYYERIFIKPIPAYFYSQAFWEYLQEADDEVFQASIGFMRSYYYLIQYQIDFDKGCEIGLIPKKTNGQHPTYEEFSDFILPFTGVDDFHVNRRFRYGELRLSRINRTALLFRQKLAYFHIYPQWGSFLAHILAPVITVFAVFSVVLNSMQVGLQALDMGPATVDHAGWPAFISISLYFPIACIILIALVLALALVGICIMGVKDFIHGNNVRRRKKNGRAVDDGKSHGMVW